MKEARELYQKKEQQWQAELDTLQADYQRARMAGLSEVELVHFAQNIQQYSQQVAQSAEEEDRKMTQAVLDQINAFVESYGQEQGYDLILGTTLDGNILYAREVLDITEEVLDALNRQYNPASYE